MPAAVDSTLRAKLRRALCALAAPVSFLLGGPFGAAAALADSPCPAAFVQHYLSNGPFPTSAAAYDSSYAGLRPSHITFDRTGGLVHLDASSGGRAEVFVRVVDRFDVVGVPSGTPVNATLEFRLDGFSQNDCGSSGCGVELMAVLSTEVDSVIAEASGQSQGRRDLVTTLSLPVTLVAGTPIQACFSLIYATGPGGSASAQATGLYGVSGLPSGVRAISCAGGDVTPVRIGTWGALKARYRGPISR